MKKKRLISAFAALSVMVFLSIGTIYLLSTQFVGFADYINEGIAQDFRRFMAQTVGSLDFSLFEMLIISLAFIIAFVVILARRAFRGGNGIRFVINFVAIILLLYSGHLLALGVGYRTTAVDEKMDLPDTQVTDDRLVKITTALVEEINQLADNMPRNAGGVFVSTYSYNDISQLICESYNKLALEYGFAEGYDSSAKKFETGPIMSYLGISGIYTYYTGEANVNSEYPDYVQIFTAAHEMCHQRGILRENEANFIAYLITSTSDDPQLRYSGALNMFEHFASALYKTNKEAYYSLADTLSGYAWTDIRESGAVYKKYSDTLLERISNKINNLYLQSNGTEGVISYSKVVELVVAYYE